MGRLAGSRSWWSAVPTAGQSLVEDRHWSATASISCRSAADGLRKRRLPIICAAVGKQVLDAYEHQEYTLGTIVRKLALPREINRLPLTEIQFNLERLADKLHAAGLEIEVSRTPKRASISIFSGT